MCVGFWSLEHPDYALILCTNRDEYFSRPTAPARFHSFQQDREDSREASVISGRDLRAGGTWLGLSRTGRTALLTNITEEGGQYSSSRGQLVSSFLLPNSPEKTLKDHTDKMLHENISYAGFNLLLLEPVYSKEDRLSFAAAYVTNSGGGGHIAVRPLTESETKCGGMSNGVDGHGADQWPKIKHGVQSFGDILKSITQDTLDTELAERLFILLTWKGDHSPRDRSELRNTIYIEPLNMPISKSSGNIPDYYGTRLSTVILIGRDGRALFIERDIWMQQKGENKVTKADAKLQRVFRFQLSR